MKTYSANELNQYTSIANPAAVALRGVATNAATVTVNGNAASRDSVASPWTPWHHALPADNANGGTFTLAEIMAVINPPSTNDADIVQTTSGSVYAPPQNETLTYDDDGNLLSDGRWRYTWNGENRLVCAEEQVCPTNRTLRKVDYAYDHQGRMVWKKILRGGAEAQSWEVEKATSYLWDNFNIITETVAQNDATDIIYNIWGLGLDGTQEGSGGVGGLVAIVSPLPFGEGQGEGSTVYFPCYDANGNITEYVSADGTIVAHREYDSVGVTIIATGNANAYSHWFSTKPWCNVTGLSEYKARKYNSNVGRWLSRDLIEERGGVNLYTFCGNNSLSNIDYIGAMIPEVAALVYLAAGTAISIWIAGRCPVDPDRLMAVPLPCKKVCVCGTKAELSKPGVEVYHQSMVCRNSNWTGQARWDPVGEKVLFSGCNAKCKPGWFEQAIMVTPAPDQLKPMLPLAAN